jgi:undecaprenyl-diphosphatase
VEADLLLWVHSLSSPALDAGARIGWAMGVFRYCAPVVLLLIGWHLGRRERREALAGRPRPTLWPWLIPTSGYSFPSGHAVAGAALYPLLGWLVLRSRGRGPAGYVLGLAVGAFIGLGRLYAGVHWPSDVLAGCALGAALSLGAVRWLSPEPRDPDSP